MYRGCLWWRCPWDWAVQLGQAEGPIGLVGLIFQPRGTINTASLTLGHTNAWANFNLGKQVLLYYVTSEIPSYMLSSTASYSHLILILSPFLCLNGMLELTLAKTWKKTTTKVQQFQFFKVTCPKKFPVHSELLCLHFHYNVHTI